MNPAGFYYKTFPWPSGWWHFYERFIRRMAGLGNTSAGDDPGRYERVNAHCDVLMVGAGPAGPAAARAAGRRGAGVVLADEQDTTGGMLLAMADTEHVQGPDRARRVSEAFRARPKIE